MNIQRWLDLLDRSRAALARGARRGANRRTLLILGVAIVILVPVYVGLLSAPSGFPAGELITIEQGSSLQDIAKQLESERVVRSSLAFRALVTLLGSERGIPAGDYLFPEPRGLLSVAQSFAYGRHGLEPTRIYIPEGATVSEMAQLFEGRLLRFDAGVFTDHAARYEGYLFPDTYFLLPNTNEDTVIASLRQNFETHLETLAPDIASFGRPLTDVITMASIVEREARDYDDRRKIAGVLWRRLDIGMPLQVDAAFVYSIGKGTFDLTLDDLKSDSPYNTYTNTGLPPTPIGNPGEAAIRAAVHPIDEGYLYYLADDDGVTHFSKTYEQHLRNKSLYLGN